MQLKRALLIVFAVFATAGLAEYSIDFDADNSATLTSIRNILQEYHFKLENFISELITNPSTNLNPDDTNMRTNNESDLENILKKHIPIINNMIKQLHEVVEKLYTPNSEVKLDLVIPLLKNNNPLITSMWEKIQYLKNLSWLQPQNNPKKFDAYNVIYNCYRATYEVMMPVQYYELYRDYFNKQFKDHPEFITKKPVKNNN